VFWPRLENFLSFVLSELRRFLFVGQNRLEMAKIGAKLRDFLTLGSLGLRADRMAGLRFVEAFDDVLY